MTSTTLPDDGDRHLDAVVLPQLGGSERRHAHQPSHLLSRGQAHLPAPAEVPLRQQAESVGVGQRRRGHLEQRIGQRSVELAHGPSGRASSGSLKNLLHWIFSRGRQQSRCPFKLLSLGCVLEQRHARDGAESVAGAVEDVPDGVAGPGDAVAEAVRGHRELDRDEGASRGVRRLVVLEVDFRCPGRIPCTPSPQWSCPRWRAGTRGSRSTGSATGPDAEPTRTPPPGAPRHARM